MTKLLRYSLPWATPIEKCNIYMAPWASQARSLMSRGEGTEPLLADLKGKRISVLTHLWPLCTRHTDGRLCLLTASFSHLLWRKHLKLGSLQLCSLAMGCLSTSFLPELVSLWFFLVLVMAWDRPFSNISVYLEHSIETRGPQNWKDNGINIKKGKGKRRTIVDVLGVKN